MLEAKGLGFSVGDKQLLKTFDVSFEQGKIYALVGHNGSGKSTLLKLLAKQQHATSGDIFLKEKPHKHEADGPFKSFDFNSKLNIIRKYKCPFFLIINP